jgi:hypothetical protein
MDNGELFVFPGSKLDPTAILEIAKQWGLKDVVILGWNSDGEFVWGGSNDSTKDRLYILEVAKAQLKLTID